MPSMSVRESRVCDPCVRRLPPVHIVLDPPTSNTPVLTAGTVPARSWKLRPVGNDSINSSETTSRRPLVCTSTTGLSPVTVMLSSREPIRISTLIGAVKLASSSMLSRTTVLKPGNLNDTVYTPGRKSTIRY